MYYKTNNPKHTVTQKTWRGITVKQLRDILQHANDDDHIRLSISNDDGYVGHYLVTDAIIPDPDAMVNSVILYNNGIMVNDC